MDQSHSGSIVAAITNFSRLVLVRQPTTTRNNSSIANRQQLFNMYEHALLTGRDFWDLLVNTPLHLVDSLVHAIEEKSVNVLPTSMQKIYKTKYRSLLYSLEKLRLGSQQQLKSHHNHHSPPDMYK
jgi:hypothetical protein